MINNINYKIIVDNNAHAEGLGTEHGLAVWIEADGLKILFDTGASDLLLENAEKSAIDLSSADCLLLSHGHYDHTGGLAYLKDILKPDIKIYCHPEVLSERFSLHKDESNHNIGIPVDSATVLKHFANQIYWIENYFIVNQSIGITGTIPRTTTFEDTGGNFWLNEKCTVKDKINDDMALWLDTDDGLWVFSGCAHAGIVNTIEHIKAISGKQKVKAFIGGTHLRNADENRLRKTMEYINEVNPEIFIPCHCSGNKLCFSR